MLRIVTPALAALIFSASSAFAASEVGTIISFDRAGGELQLAAVPHPVLKVKEFMLADLESGQTVAVNYYLKGGKAIATSVVPLTRRRVP